MIGIFPKETKLIFRNGKCKGVVKKFEKKDTSNSGGSENSQHLSSKIKRSESIKPNTNPIANTKPTPDQPSRMVTKSNSEPKPIDNNFLNAPKQEAKGLNASTEDKTQDSFPTLDLSVVKIKLHDVICRLGQETLSAQKAIPILVVLAIGVNNNKLATEGTLPSEESGNNKQYVIEVIYDVVGKLGSRTPNVSEVITQLFGLTTRLSAPPIKSPPTKISTKIPTPETKDEIIKPKDEELAKATDTSATGKKEDVDKTDGIAQESDLTGGKGKGKKKPTRVKEGEHATPSNPAQDKAGEEKDDKTGVTPAATDKPDKPIQSIVEKKKNDKPDKPNQPIVEEKKNDKKGATLAVQDDEKGDTSAVPTKENVLTGSGAPKNKPLASTTARSPSKTDTELVKPAPHLTVKSKAEDGVLELKVKRNGWGGGEMILPPTAQSLFSASAPANQDGGEGQAPQPSHAQSALGGPGTGNYGEGPNDRLANLQARLRLGQRKTQVGETGNSHHGFEHRNIAVSPILQAEQFRRIGENGQKFSSGPQSPSMFSNQPHLHTYISGASASESQAPYQPQQTLAREISNPHEFGYHHVAKSQAPFPPQDTWQFGAIDDTRGLGYQIGSESQYPSPPQQTPQAGKPRGFEGLGSSYTTRPQGTSMFPIQQSQQGSFNGAPAMHSRETLGSTGTQYRPQVPINDRYDRMTETTPHQARRSSNDRSPYAHSTLPAYSNFEPGFQSLPQGRTSPEIAPDSPESASSSESILLDRRENPGYSYGRQKPEERGEIYVQRHARQNSGHGRSDGARSHRPGSLPRQDRSPTRKSQKRHESSSGPRARQSTGPTNLTYRYL
ncbi:hypothetical protein MMC31_005078 [Peltigera leucophlebia]|nr:hypothetical protein [Peltigera leucophlebia]